MRALTTLSPALLSLLDRAAACHAPSTVALGVVAVARLIPGAPRPTVDVLDAVEAWARGEASEWEIERELVALREAFHRGPSPALSAAEYAAALATVGTSKGVAEVATDAVQYAVDAGVGEGEAARALLGGVVGEGRVAA